MQSHIYAGFLGGFTSSFLLQPLDLIKTRMQQQNKSFKQTLKTISSPREAWRGTLPSLIRTSVGAGLYLGVLNELRKSRQPKNKFRKTSNLPQISALDNVLTGALARAVVGVVMMPITVVKIRFESNSFQYKGMSEAFKNILKENGFRGLFSGVSATLSRDAPYAGIYMLFYEISKDHLQQFSFANSLAAINAAVLASTLTAPFDTLKTKIQTSSRRLSWREAWGGVYRNGLSAVFSGLSMRLLRKGLSAGISWGIYEEVVRRGERSERTI